MELNEDALDQVVGGTGGSEPKPHVAMDPGNLGTASGNKIGPKPPSVIIR